MKIAFDNQIFNQQRYGGISRYFVELSRHINLTKHEAKIFAGWHINEYLQDLPLEQVIGKKIKPLPKTGKLRQFINNAYLTPQYRRWQPDIYHHTYYFADPAPAVPNVITVYDMIHELYPDDFGGKDKTRFYKQKSINRADHVICISEATKQDLMQILTIPENKISVVYLGFLGQINLPNHPPTIVNPTDKPYLLYVGARGGYKNFSPFITAYSRSIFLKENFDVIAFGGGSFTHQEHLLFQRLNLSPTQVRHQYGNDEVLSQLYRHAQAFIYPSLYEGFGIPPLEAMAHHCPVICSNTSSIPEVVGDAGAYFDPHNLDEMQQKIEAVIQDTDWQIALKAKGQQRIEQFSWQKCAKQTLQVYQNVL